MSGAAIAAALALPLLYWERHGAFSLLIGAMSGKYSVKGAYPHAYGIGASSL